MTAKTQASAPRFLTVDGREFDAARLERAIKGYEAATARADALAFSHCRCSRAQLMNVGCDCESQNLSDEETANLEAETAAIMPQSTPLAVFDFGLDYAKTGVSSRYGYRAVRDHLFGAEPVVFNAAGRKAWAEKKAAAEAAVVAAADELECASADTSRPY